MFVAECAGELIGHSYWEMCESKPQVFSIFVARRARRRGIGFELLQKVESDLLENGYQESNLSTRAINPAQKFFQEADYDLNDQKYGWIIYKKQL